MNTPTITIEKNFELFKFPAGEIHFKALDHQSDIIHIPLGDNLNINDWIIANLLANSVYEHKNKQVYILMPYLPYSRQDRRTSSNEPFSLKIISKILNLMKVKGIITLDVHSDVAGACIDSLINIPPEFIWNDLNFKDKTLIIPDQGAYKKLKHLGENFNSRAITIKERDIKTGHVVIKDIFLPDNASSDFVIVDDICDGGATFIQLIDYLQTKFKVNSVELVITHGIFSKGIDKLFSAGINKIFTTDSFMQMPNKNLIVKSAFDIVISWLKKHKEVV